MRLVERTAGYQSILHYFAITFVFFWNVYEEHWGESWFCIKAIEMWEVQVLVHSENGVKWGSHSKSGPVTEKSNLSGTFYFSGSHSGGLETCTSTPLPHWPSTAKAVIFRRVNKTVLHFPSCSQHCQLMTPAIIRTHTLHLLLKGHCTLVQKNGY